MAQLAYEEAARHCEGALQALELAGAPDERRRCELLLTLGTALASARRSAEEAFEEAATIAEAIGLGTFCSYEPEKPVLWRF